MTLWLVIIGMGIVTYAARLSVFVFVHHGALPEPLRQALRYVTPAVLTAILVPAVLYAGGDGAFEPWISNPRLPAALAAAAVAWATGNVWTTITAGMTALWLVQWAV